MSVGVVSLASSVSVEGGLTGTNGSRNYTRRGDLDYGFMSEQNVRCKLEDFYRCKMIKDENKYALFDFHSEQGETQGETQAELKTRRIRHDMYPTAMVGANKVRWAEAHCGEGKQFWFWFQYTDGLYFIAYQKEVFDEFMRGTLRIASRSDVGRTEESEVVYIPVGRLRKYEEDAWGGVINSV